MRSTSRALAAAATALVLAGSVPVWAQQPGGPAAKMSIVGFEPWTEATRPLRFTIVVTNTGSRPIEDPVVRTTIYRRVLSRSALHVALEGRRLRSVVAATTDDILGPIAAGETKRQDVTHDLTALANVFRRGQGGVYPIEITLSGSDRELASGVSALVFIGEAPKARLNVSVVLPLHRPPMFDPDDGAYLESSLARELGRGGFVSGTAAFLASAGGIPITVAPSGLLLDELAGLADGYRRKGVQPDLGPDDPFALAAAKALEDLRAAAGSNALELATTTYAWADVVPLIQSGLGADAAEQISLGRTRVTSALGRAPTPEVLVPAGGRMDARGAEAMAGLGIRRMVVAPDVVPPQPGIFGPDHPLTAHASGGLDFLVLLSDNATGARLTQPPSADPTLVAQGIVAEAAMAFFERPTLSATRSLVIAPPAMPDPALTAPFVGALAAAPWVRLRTLSDMIAAIAAPEEKQPLAVGNRAPRSLESSVRSAEAMIDTLGRVVSPPGSATKDLEKLVLIAQSYDWAEQPARGERFANAARRRAREVLDKIVVVPPDPKDLVANPGKQPAFRKVTLTSRAGPLPVTVQNDTGSPVTVLVRVSSAKISFTKDRAVLKNIARRETVTFTAAARASGLSPVRVELLTPDGARLIGTGTVLVQSSAVSAVALAATGGGAAFLIAAWVRRSVRRRRNGGGTATAGRPVQPGGTGSA